MQKIENYFHNSQCKFLWGSTGYGQTQHPYPEIALIGRSNVGKSSLINALLNKKSLARTSNTPGRTQQLNYFSVNEGFVLVDMPGYGFAKSKRALVEQWQSFTSDYFQKATKLLRTFVLIDARRGVLDIDQELVGFLHTLSRPFQVIFTKVDLVKPSQLAEVMAQSIPMLNASEPPLAVSSSKKIGIDILRKTIYELVFR